jgi:hypothetical protein
MGEKRFEIYAPVIIPTLCRFEHFKRCIDSLSRCTGAEYTDVYVGIDYPLKDEHWNGYLKICDYIKKVSGFRNLIVLKREKNYGVSGNTKDLKEIVRRKSDRYIYSEDDNEFAPNFLEYMNEGLTRFKNEKKVIYICGARSDFGADFSLFVHDYEKNVFPAKDYNASGVGIWFDKSKPAIYTKTSVLDSWKLTYKAFQVGHSSAINRMLHQLNKDTQLPDVCRRLDFVFNDKYCIFPIVTKVRNWGYDGTGINSDNNPDLIRVQELDTMDSFKMDEIEIKEYQGIDEYVKKLYSESAKMRMIVMIKYLYYKLTKKNFENTSIYKQFIKPTTTA